MPQQLTPAIVAEAVLPQNLRSHGLGQSLSSVRFLRQSASHGEDTPGTLTGSPPLVPQHAASTACPRPP